MLPAELAAHHQHRGSRSGAKLAAHLYRANNPSLPSDENPRQSNLLCPGAAEYRSMNALAMCHDEPRTQIMGIDLADTRRELIFAICRDHLIGERPGLGVKNRFDLAYHR